MVAPVPLIVQPDQVVLPRTVTVAAPVRVPPLMVRAGKVTAPVPLTAVGKLTVPLVMVSGAAVVKVPAKVVELFPLKVRLPPVAVTVEPLLKLTTAGLKKLVNSRLPAEVTVEPGLK